MRYRDIMAAKDSFKQHVKYFLNYVPKLDAWFSGVGLEASEYHTILLFRVW
jgi:hypothetical protein